ncbi:hypothetical protein K2173_016909 [Erythroxylum novogranatense]|uniref:Uncharacterized protein n=1 Tax=Erythroxylum novogranatense TaxID=1862640 RepID=A0AAV8U5D8_9ROSI|nr:hypothetical protein K2173_016909 [Erythroxylum novogranatense]
MNGRYCTESLDSLKMKTFEQQESSRSWNNIMMHRLKNRERQRRYRTRKRLETEMKMTCVPDQSPVVNVEVEMNGNDRNFVAQVHCKRNWKKDARANACKDSDDVIAEAPQMKALHAENPPSLQNSGTYRPNIGRRNWKAEARKTRK